MAKKLILLMAVSSGLIVFSSCYPTGAPIESCKIFTANHTGHLPQRSEPKYDIIIDPSSVSSGGKATVTIQGIAGEYFKGFLIQGRDEATNKPVGKFTVQGESQTLDCSGPGSSDTATHTNNNDKSQVTLKWTAPASFKGNVVFRAVIVKTYELFWDNLLSTPLTVN